MNTIALSSPAWDLEIDGNGNIEYYAPETYVVANPFITIAGTQLN